MEANRKSRIHMRDPNVREINMKAKEKRSFFPRER
jgi:hypothetical protein